MKSILRSLLAIGSLIFVLPASAQNPGTAPGTPPEGIPRTDPAAPQSATPQTPPPATGGAPAKPAARRFDIRRATSGVKVDGVLDEPAWAEALVIDLPYEWSPGENTPPPVRTDFLVTYDHVNLYAAWRAYDPEPGAVRAHLMDRDLVDTLVQDDHVVLMLDTFNDERRGFQFRVNPLGVQADAVFSENEGIEDFSFDMIWDSAGRITDEGYIVEIAIPFNQLRFPRTSAPQTWGFDIGRSYPRNVRHRLANAPRERGNNCLLCQIDKVSGFTGLEPGRNLEVSPTLTASRTDRVDEFNGLPGDDLESGDEEVEPGVSVRWGITPSISLNAAINPDFSQVEADVAQLEVNERFALFFPEKRPFFLEGIDFFSTPINAIFTRTVADPEWGLKLTGKEGRNAVGVFVADDTDDGNLIILPTNRGSSFALIQDSVRSSVLRYRRDIGTGSTLGVLYTGREANDYHNRVAGLDGYFRLSTSDTIQVQYLSSDTEYPFAVGQQLDGEGMYGAYEHQSRDWNWSVNYTDYDPEFRADAGFIPRVDIREGSGNIQRQLYGGEDDWYSQLNIGFSATRTEDHDSRLTDQGMMLYGNFTGPMQSFLEVALEEARTFFVDTLYDDLQRAFITFNIQPTGAARFALGSTIGETVDFDRNERADIVQLAPSAELKIGRHVNAKLDHTLRRLDADSGRVEANLSQLRLIYNFNVRTFVRGIFQYLDFAGLENTQDSESLFTQLLFSYKLNPQTVLFLGYSDNRVGFESVSLGQTDRSFFFKVGYAWVL
jgi:hypothetical protein